MSNEPGWGETMGVMMVLILFVFVMPGLFGGLL